MYVHAGTEFDFFGFTRAPFRVLRLLLLLIDILSEVHDATYRRASLAGYFDQIEPCLLGDFQGLFRIHDAHLVSLGAYDSDFWDANAVVTSNFREWVLTSGRSRLPRGFGIN